MRKITYFLSLLAALFAAGTQTLKAQMLIDTNKWYTIYSGLDLSELAAATSSTTQLADTEVADGSGLFFLYGTTGAGKLFRFVFINDHEEESIYAIQNKATGLYISKDGTLTKSPGYFKTEGKKTAYAIFLRPCNEQGEYIGYFGVGSDMDLSLDAQGEIRFAENSNVEADYTPNPIYVTAMPGTITTQCWPVPLSAPKGMYNICGFGKDMNNGKKYICLKETTYANAGMPFIYVHAYDERGNDTPVSVAFTIGDGVRPSPQGYFNMYGTYEDKEITDDYTDGYCLICASKAYNVPLPFNVPANSAYIERWDEDFEDLNTINFDFSIEIELEDLPTSIETSLQKMAKAGNVYDMSGRQVATGMTINDIHRLPAGTYILGGAKVMVK